MKRNGNDTARQFGHFIYERDKYEIKNNNQNLQIIKLKCATDNFNIKKTPKQPLLKLNITEQKFHDLKYEQSIHQNIYTV